MQENLINRRTWLTGTAGALGLAGLASAASGNFRHPLGVQLYTVRGVITGHEEEVLKRISEIGYTELETTGQNNLDTMEPLFKQYKLKPVSIHLNVPVVTGKWANGEKATTLPEAIDAAKKHGAEYLVFPYVPPSERGSADGYKALAGKMNEAGRQVHDAGLTFCYHNHAFEFGGAPGERPIDIMNSVLDKKLVNFEIDVFWVSVAGNDPVKILQEFAGRVPLVHLKDKASGTPVQYNENVPKQTFREVGSGSLEFAPILRACEKAGVKHYFVEQDQTPADPIDSLHKSYDYLRSVKV